MIPPDVVSRLQLTADTALRPVAPAQEISDKLSDLVAGQRVMAEIQSLLPNGTYRALINQRSVTLALPFSARSGDALELEVTESDGKLALAVVSHRDGNAQAAPREAVSATLSRTGQLIGQLFARVDDTDPERGKALPLNGNRPIAATPPQHAEDIAPLLKQAITQSGMFYEAHQAEWVEGRFPRAQLLQEPQGQLSSPTILAQSADAPLPNAIRPEAPSMQASERPEESRTPARQAAVPDTPAPQRSADEATRNQAPGQIVAPQAQAIVHQQLEALANQTFVWQGQIWPGQDMRWEIEEDGHRRDEADSENVADGWQTRLDLSFPRLGGIQARLQLHGNEIALTLTAQQENAQTTMQSATADLRQRLSAAGLSLTAVGIVRDEGTTP